VTLELELQDGIARLVANTTRLLHAAIQRGDAPVDDLSAE
jgi:hypothetical protein